MKAHLGNQPVQVLDRSKNLIPFPYVRTSYTVQGIAFTVDENGWIYVSGKMNEGATFADFIFTKDLLFPAGTYYVSGCPKGGDTYTYRILCHIINSDGTNYGYISNYNNSNKEDTQNPATIQQGRTIKCSIRIGKDYDGTPLVFKPMLNEGTTATEYAPYIRRFNFHSPVNLIKMPYTDGVSKTYNGITFTVDEETGYITANGTATANSTFRLNMDNNAGIFPNEKIFAKCESLSDMKGVSIVLNYYKSSGGSYQAWSSLTYNSSIKVITAPSDYKSAAFYILIASGTTVNNLVFKPELIKLLGD